MFSYLASPYTDPDPNVREERFRKACVCASRMLAAELEVFSPIAHGHPIELIGGTMFPHARWMRLDLEILRRCDRVCILAIDGWDRSVGVRLEMGEAARLGIPVVFVNESGEELKGVTT